MDFLPILLVTESGNITFGSGSFLFLVAISLALCAVTLVHTNFGLVVLIFSMLLSPEITVAEVPQRAVAIRVDDILLLVVFFTWIAKMAIFKEIALFKPTPLNGPILFYILCCIFATTFRGMREPHVVLGSFFYLFKYVEYFLLYFMFVNAIETEKQARLFLTCALVTCLVVCVYVFNDVAHMGGVVRASAPFEGENREPASLGGYLLFMLGVTLGLWAYAATPREKFFYAFSALMILSAFVFSTARGAFLGAPAMYFMILLLTKKRRILLSLFLILVLFLIPLIVPPHIIAFAREAFTGKSYKVGSVQVQLGGSGVARVENWRNLLKMIYQRPFLGHGVAGAGLIDNQYLRVLAEVGLVGMAIYLWLLWRIYRMGIQTFYTVEGALKGLALGFLGGFVGLLIQGLSANSFIIVRIMEPFWFAAAIVTTLPQLKKESETMRAAA